MKSYRIEELQEGMSASYSQTISDCDIKSFAGISGDHNPIHVDEEYANTSRYKKRIAHGLLTASFFSSIFGTQLPGRGCVYASQSLEFKRPVYIGDTVVATVKILEVDVNGKKVRFETNCSVKNRVVTTGTAVIFMPGG